MKRLSRWLQAGGLAAATLAPGLFGGCLSDGGTAAAATPAAQAASQAAATAPAPRFTVGEASLVPVRGSGTWYINDSVFPYLRDRTGAGHLAFWGAGRVRRYAGAGLDALAPASERADGAVTVTYAPGVDASKDNGWDYNGDWMLTATRAVDGTLVAFVHGENHQFKDGRYGEWNSSGVWTSEDDGRTWINHGQVVASPKPDRAAFGGLGLSEVIWDPLHHRWLGYGGGRPFISTDAHAAPGTWYGYHDGTFGQHIEVGAPVPPLSEAPGLERANVTWGGLTYNDYLGQFILTWMPFGSTRTILAAFSPDGLHWGAVTTLFAETAPDAASYPLIVGDSDTRSGQDCFLVYMRTRHLSADRLDMVRRPLHFER
jgi:hypothetical protein